MQEKVTIIGKENSDLKNDEVKDNKKKDNSNSESKNKEEITKHTKSRQKDNSKTFKHSHTVEIQPNVNKLSSNINNISNDNGLLITKIQKVSITNSDKQAYNSETNSDSEDNNKLSGDLCKY